MNSVSTSMAPAAVMGHFDGMENGMAVGWAFDSAKPGQRLPVEVLCNGEVVAFGIANEFREDLASAGIGDGKHLFRLPVSYELMDGHVHNLTAREATTGLPLHGGGIPFGPENRYIDIDVISRKHGLALLEKMLQRPEFAVHADKASALAKLYRIGSLAQETGRLDDARYVWETLQKALGENSLCHCKLGEVYLLQHNADAALHAYRAAAAEIQMHTAHLGMANALLALREYDAADDALIIAEGLCSNDTALTARIRSLRNTALLGKADILIGNGDGEAAARLLATGLFQEAESDAVLSRLEALLVPVLSGENAELPSMHALHKFKQKHAVLEIIVESVETQLATRKPNE